MGKPNMNGLASSALEWGVLRKAILELIQGPLVFLVSYCKNNKDFYKPFYHRLDRFTVQFAWIGHNFFPIFLMEYRLSLQR